MRKRENLKGARVFVCVYVFDHDGWPPASCKPGDAAHEAQPLQKRRFCTWRSQKRLNCDVLPLECERDYFGVTTLVKPLSDDMHVVGKVGKAQQVEHKCHVTAYDKNCEKEVRTRTKSPQHERQNLTRCWQITRKKQKKRKLVKTEFPRAFQWSKLFRFIR